jgi:hypothetical protein
VTVLASETRDRDIAADVTLVGALCGNAGLFCGTVEGNVSAPIALDLTGSTFTLSRVDEGAPLPEPPPIDCAGNLADPL